MLLPLAVFFSGGAIDTIINYSNCRYLNPEDQAIFPIALFGSAAIIGSLLLLIKWKPIKRKNLIAGICLGIPNYFALLSIFKALSYFQHNGAVFFPVYNIGIILVSTVGSILIFKEKLYSINYIGFILSLLALFLLSYQEIISYIYSW